MIRKSLLKSILSASALLICSSVQAQWVAMGATGIQFADFTSIAVNSHSIPYVCFSSSGAQVLRYNGVSWAPVGNSPISAGNTSYTQIEISATDTAYIAYQDGFNSSKATVKKFDGTNWVPVGGEGFSTSGIDFISMVVNNDTPWVAFSDWDAGNKVTVMKFDGASWQTIGSAGFSAGQADLVTLAIDAHDVPYVSFRDGSLSENVTVMKFDGSNWINVGTAGIATGQVWFPTIAIDANNTPFIAYRDVANGDKAIVKKFDGTSWVTVGTPHFSGGMASYTNIVFDNNYTPHVSYRDVSEGGKVTVMKFDGTDWVPVGSAGVSPGNADDVDLAFTPNNEPIVVFLDQPNSLTVTVMSFGNIPLSLDLLDFYGRNSNGNSVLNWTAVDKYTESYTIERSVNGKTFSKLAAVQGKADGTNSYSYTDFDAAKQNTSTLYYRLKHSEKSGEVSYSDIIAIKLGNSSKNVYNLYPNPNNGNFYLSTNTTENASIAISDVVGNVVMTGSVSASHMQNYKITIDNLAEGMYFLRVVTASGSQVIPFTKK